MRTFLLGLGLALAPATAQAETPWWAIPTVQLGLPAELSRTVTQADDVARAQVYPTVPESVPEIVRKGINGNGVCMGCHLPSGFGQPQSAPLAGLPVDYYIRTMNDFRSGARKAYRPNMVEFAKGMSDEQIRETAAYYASLRPGPWVTVRESDTAPKLFVAQREIPAALPDGGDAPLGMRIVELRNELTKPYFPPGPAYIAYVPRGSIARGAQLVTNGGGGKTVVCGTCHGANLLGVGDIPGIAGRSALHTARQLFEYQDGTRDGASADAMKQVVTKLQEADIIAIAAYVASRPLQ